MKAVNPAGKRRKPKKKSPVKYRRNKLQEELLKLSVRQLKYRKNRMSGMSIYASARAAGYSESYSRGWAAKKLAGTVKNSIIEELEMAGATNKCHAKEVFRIATRAMKMQSCTVEVRDDNGDLTIEDQSRVEVPDEHARLQAWEHIAKLKKQISAPASSMIPEGDFTRLTIVVERDGNKEQVIEEEITDAESGSGINSETALSMDASNE